MVDIRNCIGVWVDRRDIFLKSLDLFTQVMEATTRQYLDEDEICTNGNAVCFTGCNNTSATS